MTDSAEPLQNVDDGLQTLVVAIDSSADANRVISSAARLIRSSPAAILHLAHVFLVTKRELARGGPAASTSEALEDAKEYLEAQARTARKQCRNQVVTHLLTGDPTGEIVRLTGQLEADLLVVGTQDNTGSDRLLLGANTESIMRKAPCSVLVVRRPPVEVQSPLIPIEPLAERVYRFARALIVGSGATLVDFSIFTTCMRAGGVAPTSARLPALMAGACVQFLGNRTFTFRAQAGSLTRQAKLFLCAELVALGLNWSTFRLLVPRIPVLPPEIVGFIGSFIVFVGFAYPMRRLVIFRIPPGPVTQPTRRPR